MLFMKLQTFVQRINAELEETSNQIVRDMPSVVRSVDVLAQDVSSLKDRMSAVRKDIEHVETDTAHTMKVLIELDAIKGKMEATSAALQEADNWTTLSADAEEAFRSDDVRKAAATLLGMRRSLLVLSDVPDHAQRQQLLSGLESRLEALISPKLLMAMEAHNADLAKEYTMMFGDIGRKSQILALYLQCHKAAAQDIWASYTQGTARVADWLPLFYDRLLQIAHREIKFCPSLFSDPAGAVTAMLAAVLTSLSPTLKDLLLHDSRTNPGGCLALVAATIPAAVNFATALPVSSPALLSGLVGGFTHFQLELGPLLSAEFDGRIAGLQISVAGLSPDDAVELLRAKVPLFFDILGEGRRYCQQLTDGAGMSGLIEAISFAMDRFCAAYSTAVEDLRKACAIDGDGDIEDGSSSSYSFSIVELCGDIIRRTDRLETTIREAAVAAKASLTAVLDGEAGVDRFSLSKYCADNAVAASTLRQTLVDADSGTPLLPLPRDALQELNRTAHAFAYASVMAPIAARFREVSRLPVWIDLGGDTFSLSPLAYVTKIGEYLLTLPQQLEPFLSQEDDAFAIALRACSAPFEGAGPLKHDENAADAWLNAVCHGTMELYRKTIWAIPKLSTPGARQLSTDIDYLCNVLSALDVATDTDVLNIAQLLSCTPEEFASSAATLRDARPAEVAKLAAMRGIPYRP
eukprot:m.47123 g.47123  ORF g.47123 m.47123 type:complete len:692 (-) comp5953_c0_seq2:258-2333(-)